MKHTKFSNAALTHLAILVGRGQSFECNGIAGGTGEALVPEPLGGLLGTLDPGAGVRTQHLLLLLCGRAAKLVGEARVDDDNVTRLEGGSLVLCHILECVGGDGVVFKGRILDALCISISLVVEKDATSDETATLVPVVEGRKGLFRVEAAKVLRQRFLGWNDALVGFRGWLVSKVAETVPLTAALSVEFNLM